jgi:pimeloyl-ACP methyl ester carboxylesterase
VEISRRAALETIAGGLFFQAAPLSPRRVRGDGPCILTFRREPQHFFDALVSRYRVIEIDYPPSAVTESFIAGFTPDRVCADVLAVADAEGVERFAWFGYSWGGVVGLQLAARTERLSALVCGGWPPLGARYDAMVPEGVRRGDDRMYNTFYRALARWPEREIVSSFRVPRLAFAGMQDVIEAYGTSFPMGPTLLATRRELEQLGWTVRLVDGFGHELGARPDIVVPLVSAFLDPLRLPPGRN